MIIKSVSHTSAPIMMETCLRSLPAERNSPAIYTDHQFHIMKVMMTATTGRVEEKGCPPVNTKPIFAAASCRAWKELALWVYGWAKALKLAMNVEFEPIKSARKARKVPTLAMVQQIFCTRKAAFVPDDMAKARMMISRRPRPKVHNWPVASLPPTALPALINPLF